MANIDEINKLKKTLEIREKFIEQLKEYNEQLKARIMPFEDSYFNGLSPIEIAELAKKSIRLTCENRRLEDLQQEIKAIAENNIDCKQYEIDHDCFNDTRCNALRELIETLQQILDLITKAEEE